MFLKFIFSFRRYFYGKEKKSLDKDMDKIVDKLFKKFDIDNLIDEVIDEVFDELENGEEATIKKLKSAINDCIDDVAKIKRNKKGDEK